MSSLVAKFREVAGEQCLSPNTVETYLFWMRKFYAHTGKAAGEWQGSDVSDFLHQMQRDKYSSKSRKQALCAVVFAFKHLLKVDPGKLDLPPMPHEAATLRIVPNRTEIGRIVSGLHGQKRLIAATFYGSGTRVEETCRLRVKDVDFEALTLRVHGGKGNKSRLVLLPEALVEGYRKQIAWRAALHEMDLSEGAGLVELPGRYGIKNKGAARDLGWQFLFPSNVRRGQYRWHLTPEAMQAAIRASRKAAGILKRVTPHTFRHAFATDALRTPGNDIETIRELLGHDSIETTAIYLHADAARGVSPLDALPAVRPARQYVLRRREAMALEGGR